MIIIDEYIAESPEEVVMIDAEGKGDAINIPAYLISNEDGQKFIHHIEDEDDDVMINVSLEIGYDNNEVEYDLWYSTPADFLTQDIDQIGAAQQLLK